MKILHNLLCKILFLLAVGLPWSYMSAATVDDDATAAVTCTVDGMMEWAGNFTDLAIVAHITTQGDVVTRSGTATLYTNGDVHISADNAGTTARLTLGSDFLVTEYSLSYDGDGVTATGGDAVDYTDYTTFLATPSVVTHVTLDGAVVVTLTVRASNQAGDMANAGEYTATQTLTASWGSGL